MSEAENMEIIENEVDSSGNIAPTHSLAFSIFPKLIEFDTIPSLFTELDFQTKLFYLLFAWLILSLFGILLAWIKFGTYLNNIHSDGTFFCNYIKCFLKINFYN